MITQNLKTKFKGLNNTRDLGGIRTKDNLVIKKGLLFRSGALYKATDNDLDILKDYGIEKVYDFRAPDEREAKPDKIIGDEENIYLPIVEDLTMGLTRDEKSDKDALRMMFSEKAENPDWAIGYMKKIYSLFVTSDFAISQYGKFLNGVLEAKGGVLWHCTAGKDRAGFATILVLETLGVDYDVIKADYLKTNEYLKEENERDLHAMGDAVKMPRVRDSILALFSAREDYIDTVYTLAEENYGSMLNFIINKLGFGEDKIQMMREKYLVSEEI